MDFSQAVTAVFKKYATFDGRSSRPEFWWFLLFGLVVRLVLDFVGLSFIGLVFSLAVLVPSVAVSVRRLHDTDKSGWLSLLWFVPVVGWAVMVWLAAQPGTEGDNRYGADPLGADVGEVFS